MPEYCPICDPECQEDMDRALQDGAKFPYFTCPKLLGERNKLLRREKRMNNEEKILEILTQIQPQISSLEQGQKNIERRLDTLEAKVDALQEDMDEVKLNVRFLWEEYERQDKRIDRIAK